MVAAGDAALGRELMSAADVGRTISRIAHQIIEKTALDSAEAPRVVLLGIPTRGVILAQRLAANIGEYSGVDVARGALDITLYRDDLMKKPPRPLEATSIPAGGIEDALVILVDDVLYSGRSVRSALDALRDVGRPRAVQLARLACLSKDPPEPGYLDTLAAAYAAAGRFDDAVSTAQRAAELAAGGGNQTLAGAVRGRLERYRQHRTAGPTLSGTTSR